MKLHYSQTQKERIVKRFMFQYLMKLHYSQTAILGGISREAVSVPYEITLLSNAKRERRQGCEVSVPYEITLLSNV